ncbi:MAG: hypothetical protein HZA53_00770 [Planctomycetes bacterium]|nr:hypothetical protein [Planctomycetota bacterium]
MRATFPHSRVLACVVALVLAAHAAAQTTFTDVHPVFVAKCTPCHSSGGAGGLNIAASNIATAYAQSQLPSNFAPGHTKGYASLLRVQDGSMPTNANCTGIPAQDVGNSECLTASEQALLVAWITDGQLAPLGPGATAFCPGDGTSTACPCANDGGVGRGCANSAFATGALLASTGAPLVGADTVQLQASGMTGATCVFFQGSAQQAPVIVDDGLGCVTGTVIRLGTKAVVSNASAFPQSGDPLIHTRGSIPTAGATRYYQCFYRNAAAAFCPPATSNRTNGVRIIWGA